jgi:hypothetical protein
MGAMSDLFSSEPAPPVAGSDGTVSFTCPRCSVTATARFYGPCETCRLQLRAAYVGLEREVELAEYEPKMNVTPNAVALKDD